MALMNAGKRIALEIAVLEFLSSSAQGASLESLRARFPHSQVAHVTEGLERKAQVHSYPGGFFGVTSFGRSRLVGRAPAKGATSS